MDTMQHVRRFTALKGIHLDVQEALLEKYDNGFVKWIRATTDDGKKLTLRLLWNRDTERGQLNILLDADEYIQYDIPATEYIALNQGTFVELQHRKEYKAVQQKIEHLKEHQNAIEAHQQQSIRDADQFLDAEEW